MPTAPRRVSAKTAAATARRLAALGVTPADVRVQHAETTLGDEVSAVQCRGCGGWRVSVCELFIRCRECQLTAAWPGGAFGVVPMTAPGDGGEDATDKQIAAAARALAAAIRANCGASKLAPAGTGRAKTTKVNGKAEAKGA